MNYHKLHNYCNASIKTLRRFGDFVECDHSGYTFIDRGSQVLGVAHIDTVQTSRKFHVTKNRDEEIGQSTAAYFDPPRDYNWMFEFDRGGDTTVLYQYHDEEIVDILRNYDFEIAHGIYTDIVDLDFLECIGINFATGYHNYHAPNAYANIPTWQKSVNQFKQFYWNYRDIRLDYEPMPFIPQEQGYEPVGQCPLCQEFFYDNLNLNMIMYLGNCVRCEQAYRHVHRTPVSY